MVDMSVSLGGLAMKNPVTTASGTYSFAAPFADFYDPAQLGAVTLKGVADRPWPGNPAPRMTETPSGMINTVGLANPGAAGLAAAYGSFLADMTQRGGVVIAQAIGHSVDEMLASVEALTQNCPWIAALELNVSCPNLAPGGTIVGDTPQAVARLTKAVRAQTDLPILVKIGPDNAVACAAAAREAGADAISMVNTFSAMRLDVHTRRSRISRPTGGLSGPAIHPIAVRLVWEVCRAVDVPVCAMGGIASWEDAAEFILVGATAVAVGTMNFSHPRLALDVVEGLTSWVERQGVSSIDELRGAARV